MTAEQDLRNNFQTFVSKDFRGAIYRNGNWLIGQDCYLEIPEQQRIIKKFLSLVENAGYVRLAEDQNLPKALLSCGFGCEELLKDWRKVILEEKS